MPVAFAACVRAIRLVMHRRQSTQEYPNAIQIAGLTALLLPAERVSAAAAARRTWCAASTEASSSSPSMTAARIFECSSQSRSARRARLAMNTRLVLAQRAHDVPQDAIAARLHQLVVKLPVQAHQILDLVCARGGVARSQHLAQFGDDARLMVARRKARVEPLQCRAHLHQIARDLRRYHGDRGAAARQYIDEAFGRKLTQGLADRDPRHAQLLRQAVFDQALPRQAPAGKNGAAQFAGNARGERRVFAAEHALRRGASGFVALACG